jgi:hypothetical protein
MNDKSFTFFKKAFTLAGYDLTSHDPYHKTTPPAGAMD